MCKYVFLVEGTNNWSRWYVYGVLCGVLCDWIGGGGGTYVFGITEFQIVFRWT